MQCIPKCTQHKTTDKNTHRENPHISPHRRGVIFHGCFACLSSHSNGGLQEQGLTSVVNKESD